ncbi:MAG: PEP-CTERM sorting domain-containing protein [Pseudomonadota bacterium]
MTKYLKTLALATLLVAANSATAGLITTNTPGYAMTDFHLPTDTPVGLGDPAIMIGDHIDFATSLDGDVVNFTAKNGLSQTMEVGIKPSWWSGSDDEYYFAQIGSVNWLELIMPANTLGFSLSIDAKHNSRAWIVGVDDQGNGIDTAGNAFTLQDNGDLWDIHGDDPSFNIHLGGSAHSFGFYADNSGGHCNTISKVVIDPNYWGMGDFSIHVGDTPCVQVPEPSILMLFAAGLFGLGYARRRIQG